MAIYEHYLNELEHTKDNVVTEKIALENEIKSLSEKLGWQKQRNSELSVEIRKQTNENIGLKEELW
jgi:hypothetical protein